MEAMMATQHTTYGSARKLDFWEAFKNDFYDGNGFLIGDDVGLLPLHADFHHAITFGPTGGGKGSTSIIPNLLQIDYAFVVDPGGENTAVAIRDWRAKGYDIQIINPCGVLTTYQDYSFGTYSFNPLAILDPESPHLSADSKLIAEMLITRSGTESGSAAFFLDAATSMLRAMIIHLVTKGKPEHQHLGALNDLLHSTAAGWDKLLKSMAANDAADGLVKRQAHTLERRENQAPEEFSAIMSTAQEHLAWLDDPLMREALISNDVDFSAIKGLREGQKGGIISLILPIEYIRSHAAITRLALACAMVTMRREPLAKARPIFVLDEAAALGRIAGFESWLVTMRRYRARFWPVFQDLSQLKAQYPREWSGFIANTDIRQFLGVRDLETANYLRDFIGITTIEVENQDARGQTSKMQAQRHLLTADELLNLKPDIQIVFVGSLRPLFVKKTPYWMRPAFKGRVNRNPFYERATKFPLRLWARFVGSLARLVLIVFGPHPLMRKLYLSALLYGAFRLLSPMGGA
jgi:type IV secretion system protein VirD4